MTTRAIDNLITELEGVIYLLKSDEFEVSDNSRISRTTIVEAAGGKAAFFNETSEVFKVDLTLTRKKG